MEDSYCHVFTFVKVRYPSILVCPLAAAGWSRELEAHDQRAPGIPTLGSVDSWNDDDNELISYRRVPGYRSLLFSSPRGARLVQPRSPWNSLPSWQIDGQDSPRYHTAHPQIRPLHPTYKPLSKYPWMTWANQTNRRSTPSFPVHCSSAAPGLEQIDPRTPLLTISLLAHKNGLDCVLSCPSYTVQDRGWPAPTVLTKTPCSDAAGYRITIYVS